MSADYWVQCPFCSKATKDKIAELESALDLEYKRMTAEKFNEFKKATQKQIDELNASMKDTVCFYNSLGFDEEGKYLFSISGLCQQCNYVWELEGKIIGKLHRREL